MKHIALIMLDRIERWGVRIPNGSFYSCKFRIEKTDVTTQQVAKLKAAHPETIVYHTLNTGKILFGGTYSVHSTFWEDAKWLRDINKAKAHKNRMFQDRS